MMHVEWGHPTDGSLKIPNQGHRPDDVGLNPIRHWVLVHLGHPPESLVLNEALQKVRVGIGYKSLLYRTKVRKASGTRARLRSFDEVHAAEDGIRRHVRVYMKARGMLEALFDPLEDAAIEERNSLLTKYRPIEKSDLKAETALLE